MPLPQINSVYWDPAVSHALQGGRSAAPPPAAAPSTRRRQPQPPRAGAFEVRQNPPNTAFRRFYERGDLPVAVEHRGMKNVICWKVSGTPICGSEAAESIKRVRPSRSTGGRECPLLEGKAAAVPTGSLLSNSGVVYQSCLSAVPPAVPRLGNASKSQHAQSPITL